MSPAVFLDRDGVVNRTTVKGGVPRPPMTFAEMRLLPGVRSACADLRKAGYTLIVVTNQPDVARGTQTRERVEAMHAALLSRLPVQDIVVCYHDDAHRCACRKPKPGLLRSAARRWRVDLAKSFMVGDRWVDVVAGRAAGCFTILIERAYSRPELCAPDRVARDLPSAVRIILERCGT